MLVSRTATSEFDVIVVGAGGTGLMAAYAAARHGRSVLLLEKAAEIGGTTRLSVGTICATATKLQRDAGIDDDPNGQFADMDKFNAPLGKPDNLALRRILVDNVPETVAILTDLGVTFMGPLPEPPHTKPRLHAILPHSRGYIRHLEKACRRLGVTIKTNASASDLIRSAERVTGVRVGNETFAARRGVILASGDFSSAGVAYKARFMQGALLEIGGVNPNSTGDGQRLGETCGGSIVNGEVAWGPELRFLAPPKPSSIARLPVSRWFARPLLFAMKVLPEAWVRPFLLGFVTTFLAPSLNLFREGAVLINKRGERFCDERARPQDGIGRQPEQVAFIVFDDTVAKKFAAWPNFISTAPAVGYAYLPDYIRSRPDVYASAPTLVELAQKLGVPAKALETSVDSYSTALAVEDSRQPLRNGPFHALGPVRSWIVFNDGGLRIDEDFRVIGRDERPIPGLYAAGSTGQGGVVLEGHGNHLGWAFTSGRLAGRNAALAPPH